MVYKFDQNIQAPLHSISSGFTNDTFEWLNSPWFELDFLKKQMGLCWIFDPIRVQSMNHFMAWCRTAYFLQDSCGQTWGWVSPHLRMDKTIEGAMNRALDLVKSMLIADFSDMLDYCWVIDCIDNTIYHVFVGHTLGETQLFCTFATSTSAFGV